MVKRYRIVKGWFYGMKFIIIIVMVVLLRRMGFYSFLFGCEVIVINK